MRAAVKGISRSATVARCPRLTPTHPLPCLSAVLRIVKSTEYGDQT